MHHVDRRTPWDEIWQAIEQLVREGKVHSRPTRTTGWTRSGPAAAGEAPKAYAW
jgi:aryl-alcohol dehydrogenase-like predicted oxidoreductase